MRTKLTTNMLIHEVPLVDDSSLSLADLQVRGVLQATQRCQSCNRRVIEVALEELNVAQELVVGELVIFLLHDS